MAALDAVSPKADAKRPKFPPTSSPSSSTAARKRKLSDTDDADTKSTKAADGDKAAKTSEADTNKSASDTIPAAADTKAAKSGENDNTPGADSSKSADAAEESSAGSSLLSPSVERPKLNVSISDARWASVIVKNQNHNYNRRLKIIGNSI